MPYRRVAVRKRRSSVLSIPTDERVLAYAAALIDGEGCIRIKASKDHCYTLGVIIANTSDGMMAWLLEYFGGLVTPRRIRQRMKQVFVWEVSGKQAATLLLAVFPFLVVKRAQAVVGLQFYCTLFARHQRGRSLAPAVIGARAELKQQMQQLNRRGALQLATGR